MEYALGTKLDPEEKAYPNGAMNRIAKAFNTDTGKLVSVRCGIPDTYFTIPASKGGYVHLSDGGIVLYTPKKEDRKYV